MKNCINFVDYNKKRSVGEQIVASVLDELGIKYFYDISMRKLRGVKNGTLKFDFCIPRDQSSDDLSSYIDGYNSNFLVVEYNGIFHYHIIKGKTTKYTLTKQQMNDYIKQDFCKGNQISILWIPYWHHVKLVKQMVSNFVTEYLPCTT